MEPSLESLSLDAPRPRSGKNPAHSSRYTGTASPLQRASFGNTAPRGCTSPCSGVVLPTPTSQRPAPAHLQGRCSPPLRAGFWTPLSRSKSASPRGGGAAHPEAAPIPPAPPGTQPMLPSGQALDPWSVRGVRSTISGLESWPIQSVPGARSPPIPPPPAPASLEVGRPEGVHMGIQSLWAGPWIAIPNCGVHLTVYSQPRAKVDCIAHW